MGVLWCLEERKKVESSWGEGKFQKMSSLFWGVLGAIYSLDMLFKAEAIVESSTAFPSIWEMINRESPKMLKS